MFGLGIPHVGAKTAKILAQNYNTLDNLMNQTEDTLTIITDIGETIAKSIVEFFNRENIKVLIEELKKENINMTYLGQRIEKNENFSGKSFVLTGSLTLFTREEAK